MFTVNSCCGLVTLQIGATVASIVYCIVAFAVLSINMFDYDNHQDESWPLNLLFVLCFVGLMFTAGVVIFFSAYNESYILSYSATALVALIAVFWLVLTGFSFANDQTYLQKVCIKNRCGESFWMASLKYRGTGSSFWNWEETLSDLETEDVNLESITIENTAKKLNSNTTITAERSIRKKLVLDNPDFRANDLQEDDGVKSNSSEEAHGGLEYKVGLGMAGALIMFIVHVLFFLVTILVMFSFAQELRYPDTD